MSISARFRRMRMLVLALAAALGSVCLFSTAASFVDDWRASRNGSNVLSFPPASSGLMTDEPGKVA